MHHALNRGNHYAEGLPDCLNLTISSLIHIIQTRLLLPRRLSTRLRTLYPLSPSLHASRMAALKNNFCHIGNTRNHNNHSNLEWFVVAYDCQP